MATFVPQRGSEHNTAIGKVIMLDEEWEPSPYKADGDRRVTFVPH